MGRLVVGAKHYDLVATVGKGTFGEVTQGWRRNTGEMVAIKILTNEGHHGRVVKNELRLLQALQEVNTEESHVVHFLESFGDGACTYLVFELLEQNLFDFQKQNNFLLLPVRHVRTITAQVLVALVKLKELSIIHVDLKPENIMLVDLDHARYPFHVKLIDFGSASIFTEVCHVKEPYIQSCFYRAPEIWAGVALLREGGHLVFGLHGKEMAKPMERRKHVFSLLDQLVAVNIHPVSYPGQEALAEHCDLHRMVALVKRMLTLKHPFISLQQVKSSFKATRYYQLLRACHKDASAVEIFPGMEEGAFTPASQCSIQKAIAQMDGLSLAELVGDTGDKSQQDVCQAPIPTHYSNQHRQHHQHPKTEPTASNSILLGSPGRWEQHSHRNGSMVFGGIVEQNLPGRPYTLLHAKVWPQGGGLTQRLGAPGHGGSGTLGAWGPMGCFVSPRCFGPLDARDPWCPTSWVLRVPGCPRVPQRGGDPTHRCHSPPPHASSPPQSSGDTARTQAPTSHPHLRGQALGTSLGCPRCTWHAPPSTELAMPTAPLSHCSNPGKHPGS
uniref:Protein kinase domain-containing protein n=1 Tax=Buteo japonicus TaxID=224669 RepID=A0A8C0AU60_9AVES